MTGEPEGPISLEEARRLYEATSTPIPAIAARLKMSERGFHNLRARLGWAARRGALPGRGPLRRAPGRAMLAERLRRQVGRRLLELEGAEAPAPAAEYAALLRVLNELTRLEAGRRPRAEAAPAAAPLPEVEDDRLTSLDALREAIAQRVERFGAGRDAADLPGEPAG